MCAMQTIAIIGRPNVGKSTLFNRLIGRRKSLVYALPGVTRDRIFDEMEWDGKRAVLIDTGGFEPDVKTGVLKEMREQCMVAVESADCIIFLLDAREGVNPMDVEIAGILRRFPKRVFFAANKVDTEKQESLSGDVYSIGADRVYPVSSENGRGLPELLDAVFEGIERGEQENESAGTRVAIVGRPNVGKSSLLNALLGRKRAIVHHEPGTTRDSTDTQLKWEGRDYLLIDTAGIRRRTKVSEVLEKFSVIMALRAISRCNVAVLVLDATSELAEQDMRIASYIVDAFKGMVIAVNKWDLKAGASRKDYQKELMYWADFLSFVPVVFTSAIKGEGTEELMETLGKVTYEYGKRIKTSALNEFLSETTEKNPPPAPQGRPVNIFYMTQTSTAPPRFVAFTNRPEDLHYTYGRYIKNSIREKFGFNGVPIGITFRKRKKD
jgi:GTP-binding protein